MRFYRVWCVLSDQTNIFATLNLNSSMENREVRVRFAPSPTGPLHIGGVRTALYNYLFAKKHGGKFLLRVEDTDQTRFVSGAEEYIIEALNWLGLNYDEGVQIGGPYAPYRQSERKDSYRQYAEQLVKDEFAYYGFDTPEELDEMRKRMEAAKMTSSYNAVTRQNMKNSLTLSEDEVNKRLESGEPYVIRLKVPRKEEIRVKDIIRGWVLFNSAQVDDKVLFKSDGMPTYHLANVVDDHAMKITHVIRGEEWLPSAPLHVLLYKYLGWEDIMPEFAHLPLILKPDGNGKLSKRDGDKGGFPVFPLEWKAPDTGDISSGYRESGYFPEAVVNILAFLGWNPGTPQEIFSLKELVQSFSLERVGKAGAKFDPDKAKWYNQQYLRMKNDAELAEIFIQDLKNRGVEADKDYVTKVTGLIKEKAYFASELWNLGSFFFQLPESYDEKVIEKRWKDFVPGFLNKLIENFKSLPAWKAAELEAAFKSTAESLEINPGHVMQLFRVVLSGEPGGPVLFEMTELLGKEETVNRIEVALDKLP